MLNILVSVAWTRMSPFCSFQLQSLASSRARIIEFNGRSRTSIVTVPTTSLSGMMFRLLALAKVARAARRSRSVAWNPYKVLFLVSSSTGAGARGEMTTGAGVVGATIGGGAWFGTGAVSAAGDGAGWPGAVTPGISL